jgi:uncharacterized integral membrane protein
MTASPASALLTRGWQRIVGGFHVSAPADEPDSVSEAPAESRRERFARHGRRVRLYTGAVVFVALFAALVVLSTKNTRSVRLDWVVGSAHASLVWIILAAAVIGWLLGITTAVVFHHRTRRP